MLTMTAEQRRSSQSASFHETLRRLAMIDEEFVGERAGIGLYPAAPLTLDAKTIALLQLAVSVAIGSSAACVEWSTTSLPRSGMTLRPPWKRRTVNDGGSLPVVRLTCPNALQEHGTVWGTRRT